MKQDIKDILFNRLPSYLNHSKMLKDIMFISIDYCCANLELVSKINDIISGHIKHFNNRPIAFDILRVVKAYN